MTDGNEKAFANLKTCQHISHMKIKKLKVHQQLPKLIFKFVFALGKLVMVCLCHLDSRMNIIMFELFTDTYAHLYPDYVPCLCCSLSPVTLFVIPKYAVFGYLLITVIQK